MYVQTVEVSQNLGPKLEWGVNCVFCVATAFSGRNIALCLSQLFCANDFIRCKV